MTENNNLSAEIMDSELVNTTNGINGKDVAKAAGLMAIGAALFEGGKFVVKKIGAKVKGTDVKGKIKAKLPKIGNKAKEESTDSVE